jgi:hypothetical protein
VVAKPGRAVAPGRAAPAARLRIAVALST